jgi:O-antigen/teichoic acid export membrane protein
MARVTLGGLARSSSFAGIAEITRALSSLVLTPLILVSMGLEGFGVWSLLFSLSNSINLMGVSFGNAYAKFTAEYDAQQRYDRLSEIVSSGIVLVGSIAPVALGAVVFVREPLLRATGVPQELLGSAMTAFLIVTTTVFLMLSLGCVRHVLAGLQRTDLGYKAEMLTAVVYFVSAAVLLSQGYGLIGLAAANLVGELAGIGLGWWWCRQLCPQLRISPLRATRAGLRRASSLGGRFQILYLLNYTTTEGFKLVLSALMGPAMLGSYVLARRLIRLCETAAAAIHAPMMPAFAHFHSTGQVEQARSMHNRGSRAIFAAALLSISFVAAFADPVLRLWTSQAQPISAWTVQALAATYIFKQLSAMGTSSLRAQGSFRLEIGSMVFALVSRALLLIPLYANFDYHGFVWSEAIAFVGSALVFLWPYLRIEALSLARFLADATLRPIAALLPVLGAVWWLAGEVSLPLTWLPDRWAILAELTIWGSLYLSLAVPSLWLWVLSADEREQLGQAFGRRLSRS